MTRRSEFTDAQKRQLFLLSGGQCYWCKKPWSEDRQPHYDHIIPVSLGGATNLENGCCSCPDGNLKKGSYLFNPVTRSNFSITEYTMDNYNRLDTPIARRPKGSPPLTHMIKL